VFAFSGLGGKTMNRESKVGDEIKKLEKHWPTPLRG